MFFANPLLSVSQNLSRRLYTLNVLRLALSHEHDEAVQEAPVCLKKRAKAHGTPPFTVCCLAFSGRNTIIWVSRDDVKGVAR